MRSEGQGWKIARWKKRDGLEWGESGESIERFIERDDWKKGMTWRREWMNRDKYKTDGLSGIERGWAQREREREGGSLWLAGSWWWLEGIGHLDLVAYWFWHMLSHLTHTLMSSLWPVVCVCVLHECEFGYLQNVVINYHASGGYYFWANNHHRTFFTPGLKALWHWNAHLL